MTDQATSGAARDLSGVISTTPGDGPRIRRVDPNPAGGIDALFVIDGDFVAGAPDRIFAGSHADIPQALPPAAKLRIFHVNDMHNHLFDTNEAGFTTQRLGQMVQRVKTAKAEASPDEAVLFLSAGDDHTGTLLDELIGWNAEEFDLDPSYRALSAAGLDASALGNHEFDRGAAQLVLCAGDAVFPLLSANVHSSAHFHPGQHFHAAMIAQVKGLRVGLIGLTTHVETRTGLPEDPELAVASPVRALRNALPLVEQLCDVVVVLSHCGYGDGRHVSGKAAVARDIGEADFALADTAAQIATTPVVIVGAHTHTRLNENGVDPANIRSGVLITQAEANGRFLGEITITPFDANPPQARLYPIIEAQGASDPNADKAFTDRYIAPLIASIGHLDEEVIGAVDSPIFTWPETRVSRYAGECALANFMTDSVVAQLATMPDCAVDLALLNGASMLAGVDPGPLTFSRWFDVMPYFDEVFVVEVTGQQIEAVLHSNAKRVLRPEEVGSTNVDGFVARGFLHGSRDLRYRIELNESAAMARAVDIELFGRPLAQQRDRLFRVATTTYLALGSFGERWNGAPLSGGVPGNVPGYDLRALASRNTGIIYRQLLVDFIRQEAGITGQLDGRITVI